MGKLNILDASLTAESGSFQLFSTTPGLGVGPSEVYFEWSLNSLPVGPSFYSQSIVKLNSVTANDTIPVALRGKVIVDGVSNLPGNSHPIGAIGEVTIQGSGRVESVHPLEGRFDVTGPSTIGRASFWLGTTGHLPPGATVEDLSCVYIPNMSNLENFENLGTQSRASFQSLTPGFPIINAGAILTGEKFISAPSVPNGVSVAAEFRCTPALNAGVQLKFALDDAQKNSIGGLLVKLLSNSRADFTLSLLSQGGVENDVFQVTGQRNFGFGGISEYGSGRGITFIQSATVEPVAGPTGNPVGGVFLWADANGVVKIKKPNGSITTIA